MAKKTNYSDCVAKIAERFSENLTKKEASKLINQLEKRAAALLESRGMDATFEAVLQDAAMELVDRIETATLLEKRAALMNAKKRLSRRAYYNKLTDQDGLSPDDAIQAKTVGLSKSGDSVNLSVDVIGNSIAERTTGGLVRELEKDDLLKLFHDKASHRLIAKELFEIRKDGNPGISGSKEIQKIAALVHKYMNYTIDRINKAGGAINKLDGYIIKQTHDPIKIRKMGFDQWRDTIKPLLDKKTFAGVDEDEFLHNVYDDIITGKQYGYNDADTDRLSGMKGFGNLGKKLSQERVLHFKDADSFMNYNDAFGRMTLPEAIGSALRNGGRNAALLDVFGTNPRAAFEADMDYLKIKFKDNPEQLAKITGRKGEQLEYQFMEVSGETSRVSDMNLALAMQTVRTATRLSTLGGVVITSINDIANKAVQLKMSDGSLLVGLRNGLIDSFATLKTKSEKRELALMLGAANQGAMSGLVGRHAAIDGLPGKMMRHEVLFNKLTLQTPYTDAQKGGAVLAQNALITSHKDMPFNALSERRQRYLQRYGIGEQEWEKIRTSIVETSPGNFAALPEFVEKRYGYELGDKLGALYADFQDSAVLTPGAREKAMLHQGTERGTTTGEFLRTITMYKSFPISYTTKVLGRLVQDKEWALLAHLAGVSMAFGYVSISALALANGKEPPSLSEPKTWADSFSKSGFGGIYADFLLGSFLNEDSGRFMQGPVTSKIANVIDIGIKAAKGEKQGRAAFDAFVGLLPYNNLFYLRAAMDYAILNGVREELSPGFLRKKEKKYKKEYGSEYYLPPTEYSTEF